MGKYSVGTATKNRILEKCKELFYQKGFMNTSYDDICSAADINRGLVPYHFKSKNNIAKQIYFEFTCNQRNACERVLKGEDPVIISITSLMMFYELIFSNDNLKRFWYEIATNNILSDSFFWENEVFLTSIVNGNNLSISKEELFTIYCMTNGMEFELTKNICNGSLLEPIDHAFDKEITVILGLLNYSKEEISRIISKSKKLMNNFDTVQKCHFDVEYKPKI